GIAYPFGVVGLVLFVQLLPRLLKQDLDALGRRLGAQQDTSGTIVHVLVEVMNPAVIGKQLDELEFLPAANVQVSRVLHDNRLVPLSADFTLASGQHILVVGQASHLPTVINLFGKRSERTDYTLDAERERRQIIVSSKNVVGRSLGELKLRNVFGVTVSRVMRHGLEFVPTASDEIEYGDALSVVGEPEHLERFATFAGHRARSFDETDLISLGVGLLVGMMVGLVSIELNGYRFSLGLAGGPLLVALVLGHCGRIGPVAGHLPRASQMLLMQTGSVFFLASAGVDAGGSLMSVIREHGVALCGSALIVTLFPLLIGYGVGRFGLKLNLLQIVGGVCGGMTSTPGLSAVTAQTDSDIPVVSYATAYPVALILMTVGTQVLVSALS
ncbi:MAG: TrkA C-terminal domain-containing protein, partial [Candidatus Binatia bacterium]